MYGAETAPEEWLAQPHLPYPIVYHLSKVRHNILLWYPFEKDAKLLEVGAGCGAITGVLCQKVGSVTSVELSKRRAMINYERNKSYNNLEIIVGNLNDLPIDQEYDYVVLNGVFEYAGGFTDGERPYENFLRMIAGRLKPEGKILMAIENRFGAKYLAGAPEDHTDRYFLGLKRYRDVDSVRTFTRSELQELCDQAGLVCGRFYYPYPDYKFPYEIFTDETINSSLYGRPMFQFNQGTMELFSEAEFCQDLAVEGIAGHFANSFLVEIQREMQPLKGRKIKYVKLNTDRKADFALYTVIYEEDGGTYVEKCPVGKAAENHIEQLHHRKIRL